MFGLIGPKATKSESQLRVNKTILMFVVVALVVEMAEEPHQQRRNEAAVRRVVAVMREITANTKLERREASHPHVLYLTLSIKFRS